MQVADRLYILNEGSNILTELFHIRSQHNNTCTALYATLDPNIITLVQVQHCMLLIKYFADDTGIRSYYCVACMVTG